METKQIINWLRDKAARAEELSWQRMLKAAADRLVELDIGRKTNGDWIRSMTNKELVEFLGYNCLCDRIQAESGWCEDHAICEGCLEEWLKQPAEGG